MKQSTNISFWVFITLAIILVIFSVQNSGAIPVVIIFKTVNVSLAILLALTFLAGLIAGALYAFVKIRHKEAEKSIDSQAPAENQNDDSEDAGN